jgi:thioredoxin 1
MMKVELIYSTGCAMCATARETLKTIAEQAVQDLDWREINVQEALDYAVELGVLTFPAVAIDGKLVFSSIPTPAQLTHALLKSAGKR